MVPNDIPQDVYSKVLHYVLRKIDDDATLPSNMDAVMHILNMNLVDDEEDDDDDEEEEQHRHHHSNQRSKGRKNYSKKTNNNN